MSLFFLKKCKIRLDTTHCSALKYNYRNAQKDVKKRRTDMRKPSLKSMNTNQLRELAVSMGAERKRLYGTSKQAIILIIGDLEKSNKQEG